MAVRKTKKKKKSAGMVAAIVITSFILLIVIVALVALGYIYLRLNGIKRIPQNQSSIVKPQDETFEKDSGLENNSAAVVDPGDISWPVTNPDTEDTISENWVFEDPEMCIRDRP